MPYKLIDAARKFMKYVHPTTQALMVVALIVWMFVRRL